MRLQGIPPEDHAVTAPLAGWIAAAIAGSIAPAAALLVANGDARIAGPVLALGMMGTGMIAAAVSGRQWVGAALALVNAALLVLLVRALGLPGFSDPAEAVFAAIVASISFAARGSLFARSAAPRGWWVALAVVAGEAAVLLTAIAMPGAWPVWLLALLPAQWATIALQAALDGTLAPVAGVALVALAGTAAATMFVTRLWPRRWTYAVMFTTWLALSALVRALWEAAI
ncbi:hypothetical protein [Erythrobacter colymbi]|uniref:hypothetical protein n=1 Tax=Erythrobacter colymbi TaxID=1161202 RepID=UPI001F0B4F4A|nr:hypothetical protein [Erythrobacter colymbi]